MSCMRAFRTLLLTLFALLAVAPAASLTVLAQDQPARRERSERPPQAEAAHDSQGVLRLLPADAVSEKEITLAGKRLAYTATAGTLALYDQNGDKSAAIFYTAYVAKNAAASRPLTFVFNGGPGAASVYLHFGLAGPRIADFGPEGRDGAAAKLVDNPDSWLAFTDLVFIDPIGTGWSRTAKPDNAKDFWSVRRDADSLAKAIALYVARNSRGASPKYLLGESYGGFRAGKVARALQNDQGIVVSGVVMVSPLLEGSFLWGGIRHALDAALHLPSLVATELERTKKFTPEAMAEAERFALTDYLTTLAGPPPSGEKARAFYQRIADLTGLPADVVAKARGQVRGAYLRQLRALGVQTSSYDATFAVPDPFPESEGGRGGDPILDGFTRALSGLFVSYAHDELGFKSEMTYQLLNGEVSRRWDWDGGRERAGVSDDLRTLLAFDPSFKLLVAHGRSDLVTPYGVSRYLLDQLPDAGASERVQLKLHRGGHMFYFDGDARREFTAQARAFYQSGP